MAFFATPYTIHFDDTMAYQSHHFLTSFKFQCTARESLLYGDLIYDLPGVPAALDSVHLFTADAYARNLRPAYLGDRLVILLSLEEWGAVSARFCYRVLNQQGEPICAGFQTHVCADPQSGQPIPLPDPLRDAFESLREIEEPREARSFRDQVLAGGEQTAQLFAPQVREAARLYLRDRHPFPRIVRSVPAQLGHDIGATAREVDDSSNQPEQAVSGVPSSDQPEVWVFPGQGAFDAQLLSSRIHHYVQSDPQGRLQLERCATLAQQLVGGDTAAFFSGQAERCLLAQQASPELSQIGIYLQSVLGAYARSSVAQPAILLGHSLGEIAALTVAGSLSLPDGVRAVGERVRAVRQFGPSNGRLVAVLSNRSTIAEEIALADLKDLVIAGRNHDGQTVVSGPADQIDRLRERLRTLEIPTLDIASPTSFHHPVLRPAARAWRHELQQLSFRLPTITVYSPIGRRMIGPADDIPTLLSSQLVRPFDLQGAIDDLALVGFTRLVDCGTSGVLTRLLQKIAPAAMQVINAAADGVDPANEPTGIRPSASTQPPPASSLLGQPAIAPVADQSAVPRPAIAIVGQGCLLPGGASSPEQLHATLMHGRSGIVDLRSRDPDWERDFFSEIPLADKSTSALAGVVDDRDIVAPPHVDPVFFASLSRAQQLLCVAIAPCLPHLRQADRILCLVGATADGFQDQDRVAALRYAGLDPSQPLLAERLGEQPAAWHDPFTAIRQVFDRLISTDVPVRLIDAACASSLYSVALGMSALENNEVDVVLAGGVYCPGPGNNCLFSQFGGLTASGCRPFDAGADGVVFSEGAAFVVLRRLSDARRLEQTPLAVVRGVGLSSDGRSPSANVPQSSGQMLAVRRCYENYHLDPGSISAIEGHGTSTPAGDSTEVQSLSKFFAAHVSAPLPLHSLKGLLGHTGWAAGTAAMIAVTQMFRSRTFPAQANFRAPSPTLAKANRVLVVPTQPLPLPAENCRIAIDGFGFGGANAHLVLEAADQSPLPAEALPASDSITPSTPPTPADELVVVACYHADPAQLAGSHSGAGGDVRAPERFDRQGIPLPTGTRLLPDLVDDMDISQRLALHLTSQIITQFPGFDEALRSQTSLIFALAGKTERAAEATLRVLAPRFLREWAELPEARLIQQAYDQARPAGPYTLQCMMPNVASGRAALQFNLNGPNFVVDAGGESFAAAISSAGWLLRSGASSGTKLAIVAIMQANRWPVTSASRGGSPAEYATAYAITTRRFAAQLGCSVLGSVDELLDAMQPADLAATQRSGRSHDEPWAEPPGEPGTATSATIAPHAAAASSAPVTMASQPPELDSAKALFDLHVPQWAEVPLDLTLTQRPQPNGDRCLLVVPADRELVSELLAALTPRFPDHWLVLVGPDARRLAQQLELPYVQAAEIEDEATARQLTDQLDHFRPNLILAVARPASWESAESIREAANHPLGEALFVAARHCALSIGAGQTEIWGLFPQAWNGIVHPITGPLTGLIKAVKRELPAARVGVISHRTADVSELLKALTYERSREANDEPEIVYDGHRRLVRRLRRLPDAALPDEPKPPAGLKLDRHSVIVATGGARGVTAVMAEALLRDFGCTVVAWGRSPLQPGPADPQSPEAEREFYAAYLAAHPGSSPAVMRQHYRQAQAAWETHQRLTELAALPGQVHYRQVDVNDPVAVERAIAEVQAEFGRIDLIMHGAGLQFSKRLQDRKLSEYRQTFQIKVGGLAHLMQACQRHLGRLVPVHALTSAYSIFGNDGQHDYGAANETLDRLCELVSTRGDSIWSSLAWSAWDGVGMTRGSEYQALAAQRQLALLEPPEGQQIFRQVIGGGTRSAINVPLSHAERSRYRVRTLPSNSLAHPRRTIELPIPLASMDYLEHHKASGQPTLPGAWIVEQMVRGVLRLVETSARYVTVENIRFRRFVRAWFQHDRRFRIIVDETSSGYCAWLVGDIISPAGVHLTSDEIFASAILSVDQTPAAAAEGWTERFTDPNPEGQPVADPYCNGASSVQLSGPFDCLQRIVVGTQGRSATFAPRIGGAWHDVVPALLLDASIRVAGMHVVEDALHVPTEIKRVVLPVGVSTQSLDNANWTIHATSPVLEGDDIRCGCVAVTDDLGSVRLLIEDAVVTKLR